MNLSTKLIFISLLTLATSAWCEPAGTAFTYQGDLNVYGAAADGYYDLKFELFDTDEDGTAVTSSIELGNVQIFAGIFSVELDFGSAPFSLNQQLWLQMAVRDAGDVDDHVVLAPRQKLTATPFALSSLTEHGHSSQTANTHVGANALTNNESSFNSAIGSNTLQANTTGSGNTAVGAWSLKNNTGGDANTAVGHSSLGANLGGADNTAVGSGALSSNTDGIGNTAIGMSALADNEGSYLNTAVGYWSLKSSTDGWYNVAVGAEALSGNTIGDQNTALGQTAMQSNTEGFNNVAVGQAALNSNSTGNANTAIGHNALFSNTTASNNTAVGDAALENNLDGTENVAIGNGSLQSSLSGFGNTAIGVSALDGLTSGDENIAIGRYTMRDNNTGSGNVAIGNESLRGFASGRFNIAIGQFAMRDVADVEANTAIGTGALYSTSGNNNIALGSDAGSLLTTGNNNIAIGNNGASNDDHTVRIGSSQSRAFISGIRGVTTDLSDAVSVVIDSNGQLGTVSSSMRYKKDVKAIGSASSRILELIPVAFRYKKSFFNNSQPIQYGLIAEDVAEVVPELVVRDKNGKPDTVKYHVLPTLMLSEMKKQARLIEQQDQEIRELRSMVEELSVLIKAQ